MRRGGRALIIGLGLVALASCSSTGDTTAEGSGAATDAPSTSSPTTTALVAPGGETVAGFCRVYQGLPSDVPESYVGSAEHLEDVEQLLDAAPSAVAGPVESFRDFVASGAITADPASKDTANFPPQVRQDIETIRAYAASNC